MPHRRGHALGKAAPDTPWRVARSARAGALRLIAILAAATLLPACDGLFSRGSLVDSAWHRRELDERLVRPWLRAVADNGFVHAGFSRSWQPRGAEVADLAFQARMVDVFLQGYEATGNTRYLEAAQKSLAFLLKAFRDPLHPGLFRRVGPQGEIASDAKTSDGMAGTMLALAHAYRITREASWRDAALELWRVVDTRLGDGRGGYVRTAQRDFTRIQEERRLESLLDIFEALLVMHEATGSDALRADARRVGDFMTGRLLQGGSDGTAYFPDVYDDQWRPLAKGAGGRVVFGRLVKLAYLLDQAAARGVNPAYAAIAERALDYAIRKGYDETRGGIFESLAPDGEIDHTKGAWQQAEALRALMHFAARTGRQELRRRYEQTLEYVQSQFIDATHGGWWPAPRSECDRGRCPDEQPDPYPMAAMHTEALALARAATGK